MKYRLSELFELQMGKTPARNNQEYWNTPDYSWISISDLSMADKYICNTKEKISNKAVLDSGIKVIPENTVIMSFKLSIGKVAITSEPIYSNEAIMAFIDKKKLTIIPDYLYYLLQAQRWEEGTNKAVLGKTLNKGTLSDFKVAIHPLEEQKAIVQTLDKLSTLISLRKQQLAKLDELVKARFVEMFGDLKTNEKNWSIASFTEIAIIDCKMTTDYEKYANYPHIGIDCIEKETGELKGYHTVAEDGVISGKYLFTPEHIIYSKIRPNLNKVAVPDFDGVCSADAYPILPLREKCNKYFLVYTMRSQYFLDYILQFCSRTNLPKVNKKEVSGFRTPLPPIQLQEQFAVFVQQVEKSKSTIQRSLEKLETLESALMQEYFGKNGVSF